MRHFNERLRMCAVNISVAILFAFVIAGMTTRGAQADDTSEWFGKVFTNKSSGNFDRLGGTSEPRARRSKGVQVASLGNDYVPSSPNLGKSLSGGGSIKWVASSSCLNSSLAGVIASVAAQYGSVTVSSTCRSHSQNSRAGGAPKSYHLSGNAADFRVHGNWGAAMAYLQSTHGGGFSHYGGGLFHIDTGPRRPMR